MRRLSWLLLPVALMACDNEEPVGIGSGLLPGDPVNTFVVTLEPGEFLLADTAFAAYGDIELPSFTFLANDYQGVLDAHAFARFSIPRAIAVVDTLGVALTDTAPKYVRGEILLVPDTIATVGPAGLRVAVQRFDQAWDPTTATWELASEGVPWTVPGGTPGVLIDTATYVPGDTLRLVVDSATLALWADTTNAMRGALITLFDPSARFRSTVPRMRLFARSSLNPRDTLFTVLSNAPGTRYVYSPQPDSSAGDIRYNGTPAWRSFLHFDESIASRVVSCGPGCNVPLREAQITRAELVLQPLAPPTGFAPELPTSPTAYSALVTPGIPLERSPLGIAIGSTVEPLSLDDYQDGADPVGLVITQFVRQLVSDTTQDFSTGRSEWLTILAVAPSPQTFGFGRFAPGPRLRLVLSTAREVQLP